MTTPNALYLECPSCGEETLHEVLKGRIGRKKMVMETTVKCQECGTVHTTVVREAKLVKVPVVVSDMGHSRQVEVELGEDEVVAVDDELFVDDLHVMITSIESSGEKRPRKVPVREIETLWAKRYDKIRVKISVNKGHKTTSTDIFAMPDEEFFVGDMIAVGREKAVIHRMKTRRGMVRDGSVEARDIVRVYAKLMRITYA